MDGEWQRVNKKHPCPICEKHDWCSIAKRDGNVLCMRIESGKPCANGGWWHPINGYPLENETPLKNESLPLSNLIHQEEPLEVYTNQEKKGYSSRDYVRLIDQLSANWCVTSSSLVRLGIGFNPKGSRGMASGHTFPMRSASGEIIGYRVRKANGQKIAFKDSENGLFIPRGVSPGTCALITEGESDLAAALDLGFQAIGRPGCNECVQSVVDYLSGSKTFVRTILADNDSKVRPDSQARNPGLEGAERLAKALASEGIPCRVVAPPTGCKDLRDWYKAGVTRQDVDRHIQRTPIQFPEGYPCGFTKVSNAIRDSEDLRRISDGAFRLYYVLLSYTGKNGTCFPSVTELAKNTGKKSSTIHKLKSELRAVGLLDWETGCKGRANTYHLREIPIRKK